MLTLTDLFCGAGGSSTGATSIPGVTVRMAANHWDLAVETHNTNHPEADHDCADLSAVDPRRYPSTDLLWASPECTNHSQAKGKRRNLDATPDLFGDVLPDAAAERSRATMWDVARFAEHHRYRAIIVENVVDAAKWILWPAWLHAMDCLGYDHHVVYLNSMHAQAGGLPAPQSRDRLYVVFWRRGDTRPDFDRLRPPAWCSICEATVRAMQSWKNPEYQWGRYRAQYTWRCAGSACRHAVVEPGWLPAAAAIDWSLPGERIGDRVRPLAPKTRARIEAGICRYWRPFTAEVAGNTFERTPGVRTWPVDDVLRTLHTTASKALLVPAGGTWNEDARSTVEVMRTRTTRDTEALVSMPFLTINREGQRNLSVGDTLATIVASPNPTALVMRNNTGGAEMCTPTGEVLRTLTTLGHQSLITWLYGYRDGLLRDVGEVLRTQTTIEGEGLLTSAQRPDVDDCLFRMLEPHEIAAGMAFPADYVLLGNKRERVRLAGNAVTPPAARDRVACVQEALCA